MKNFEVKSIDDGVLDVDDTSRRVKVALNKTGVKDFDNDIIEKTAFDKTIKERGPKGANLIWHLTDHNPSLKNAVGKFSELYMENDFLVGVTNIPKTTWGNDVLEFYKQRTINQHSIGYSTVKREIVNEDNRETRYNILKEIMLYEGSAVLWGANMYTPTLSVGKTALSDINCPLCSKPTKNIESGMGYIKCTNCGQAFSSQSAEYSQTLEELGKMSKMFKTGHLSDQSYELIEMKISQLTTQLQQLFVEATLPDAKSVEPENKEVLDVIKSYSINLKTDDNDRAGKKGTLFSIR